MQPIPSNPSPLVLGYEDASKPRRVLYSRIARWLASLLMLSAIAAGIGAMLQNWVTNAFLEFNTVLLFAVALLLSLRVVKCYPTLSQSTWIGSAAVFGLWTLLLVSNQTHGQPPPSDAYFMIGCAASFLISLVGLAIDRGSSFAGGSAVL